MNTGLFLTFNCTLKYPHFPLWANFGPMAQKINALGHSYAFLRIKTSAIGIDDFIIAENCFLELLFLESERKHTIKGCDSA